MTWTAEEVRTLLPEVFATYLPGGVTSPQYIAPDMPRAASAPALTGTWMASIADLRHAWRTANLTEIQRRRLLRFAWLGGDDCVVVDGGQRRTAMSLLAEWESADWKSVDESITAATEKIVNILNGESNE